MSEETRRKYFIKEIDKDNNIISQKEYENRKDFYKDFKKNNKKVMATTSVNNGLENPVYFIRSKVVFSDGNSTLCISNRGKLQKENKYEILKDKYGKDKYIVKKDENSYYRYSTDGHLIDSVKKIEKKIVTLIMLIKTTVKKKLRLKYQRKILTKR